MSIPAEPPVIRPRNQPGIALVAAIFGIVIVSLITAGAWSMTELDTTATKNRVDAATALRLAHTAETHAISLLRTRMKDTTFNRLLRGADNLIGTSDDGLLSGYPTLGDSLKIPATGVTVAGVGKYYVRITDDPKETDLLPFVDTNRRLLLTCTGVTTSGSSATINVIVSNFALPAIAVDGNAEISSYPVISGSCGGIHANGNIFGGGRPTVTTAVTATGTVSVDVTGVKLSNQPPIDIPDLNPSDFCGTTGLNWKYIGSGSPSYSSGTWRPGVLPRLGDPPGVIYCVTGNVEFQSDFGSSLLPRNVTVIASGSVKVGGKKIWMNSAHPDGITLMAGGDMDLQGMAGFTGMVYAGGQCYVSDKPYVNGQFICKNKRPHPGADYVQLSGTTGLLMSGDASFTFGCNSMLSRVYGVVSWYPTIGT